MRAILVSVEFDDFLSITLPYNRHHFEEVIVVTSHADTATKEIALANNCGVLQTDSFYDDGAEFNKWKALEEGLDVLGREGLICVMDADILWPKQIPRQTYEQGCLYTPQRRLVDDLSRLEFALDERHWRKYPLANEPQWAGYTQIFHSDDPVLLTAPWYEQCWKHAGGADITFQNQWHYSNKLRPNWTVLHLGLAGLNWCGRTTPRLDGKHTPNVVQRVKRMQQYYTLRRYAHNTQEQYAAERLTVKPVAKPNALANILRINAAQPITGYPLNQAGLGLT